MVCRYLIGVDEVGRGPIAGPLCVGACLMPTEKALEFSRTLFGIKDSKQLSPEKRDMWFSVLSRAATEGQCRLATAFVNEPAIDTHGLSFCLNRAIARALEKLDVRPELCDVLLDGGIRAPKAFVRQRTIIRGDETEPLIAGASIVAKVRRDRYMVRMGRQFPEYGFDRHKGYGTSQHYEALKQHGILPLHRLSFLMKFMERQRISLPSQQLPPVFLPSDVRLSFSRNAI